MVDTIRAEPGVTASWRRHHRPSGGGGGADRGPYILLIPAILLELLIHIVPTPAGVGISFLQLTLFYLRNWRAAPFAGLSNYAVAVNFSAATGQALLHSFTVTIIYTAIVLTVAWGFGMAGAVFTQRAFRGRGAVRTVFLIPYALPVFASVITWNFMLQRDTGMVNQLLLSLHLVGGRPFWLIGQDSFWSLVVVQIWRTWPFAFLILTAGGEHPRGPVRGGGAGRRGHRRPGAARHPAANPAGEPGPAAGPVPVDVQRFLGAVHAVRLGPACLGRHHLHPHLRELVLCQLELRHRVGRCPCAPLFLLLVSLVYLALGRRGERHA